MDHYYRVTGIVSDGRKVDEQFFFEVKEGSAIDAAKTLLRSLCRGEMRRCAYGKDERVFVLRRGMLTGVFTMTASTKGKDSAIILSAIRAVLDVGIKQDYERGSVYRE
jgi:hypothetical protein